MEARNGSNRRIGSNRRNRRKKWATHSQKKLHVEEPNAKEKTKKKTVLRKPPPSF